MVKILFTLVSILTFLSLAVQVQSLNDNEKDYTDFVLAMKKQIEDSNGTFYHSAYNRLAYLSDTFGPRLWGSTQLEQAIHQVYIMAAKEGFDSVHLEQVGQFTKWIRYEQSLTLHSPRPTPCHLKVIGLGGTVSGHVKADTIVVSSFEELQQKKDQVKGKIVVYNQQWSSYGQSVQYRSSGAWQAAQYGAVAALVRSVTPVSIESVHTGIQHYKQGIPAIPVAAISVEDAKMFARMQARNQTINLELKLNNTKSEGAYSSNVIFEIKGVSKPDEIILMGGHIDSWDTGSQTGANDDAGGFITVFQAMRLLLKNGFRPKRTLRFIAWSGEEWGDPNNGAQAYAKKHESELNKHIVAFQDDLGSTQLYGFGFSGNAEGKKVVDEITQKYMSLINANTTTDNGEAVDTGPLRIKGVPTMINLVKDTEDHQYYFTYHHSAGDSMTIMNPDELDSNVLGVATMFFILADLEQTIPRGNFKDNLINLRAH